MKLAVISGGTATNSLLTIFSALSDNISYILPISDNGGSTSELIRVMGGPAIGDIRSRISRLIPPSQAPLHELFSHRLPDDSSCKAEWASIVDGTHPLWAKIESHIRELIRPFFIEVNAELLKRSRPGKEFQYEQASIGNLFLTGARIFCGSLDSAIELMLRISMVPNSVSVLPALNTNFTHHISALLQDGTVITGQSQISHPSSSAIDKGTMDIGTRATTPIIPSSVAEIEEDAQLPFTHPDLKHSQLRFSKGVNVPLTSPIERVFYINPYGQEIHPRASARVTGSIASSDAVVFSIGSLYTSTIPVVLLQGVPEAISKCKRRIMILNGEEDRETFGMDATAYINAIANACGFDTPQHAVSHLIYLDNGEINVDRDYIQSKGIFCIPLKASAACGGKRYREVDLDKAIKHCIFWT